MSSSVHIDNKAKDILILGKGPTKGLNNTLTAEAEYSINFARPGIKFCLRLHYNGSNLDKKCPLCLRNISRDFTSINMKKIGLSGYV